MKATVLVVLLPAAFLWGLGTGHNNSPPPKIVTQVKVVSVPEVITHVETKTVTVHKPMPESCSAAVQALDDVAPSMNALLTAVGDISINLDKAIENVSSKDFAAINASIEKNTKITGILDAASITQLQALSTFKEKLKVCQQEVK